MYGLMFYDYDVNDDRAFSLEDENEFMFDLFYLYFFSIIINTNTSLHLLLTAELL